jgi:hypothetical protein
VTQVLIELVNRTRAQAVSSTGVVYPVTNWFGDDGDDCEPNDAVVCVAGSEALGWLTIDLRDFKDIVRN